MIVLEKAPELKIQSHCEAELVVSPSDIRFHDLSADVVEIRVTIRNQGERRSDPTMVRVESAPFGVFVPWRPLATLPVPALEPGESRELSIQTARPHPTPLGSFDGVPPLSVLTALSASPSDPAPPPPPPSGITGLLELFRRQKTSYRAGKKKVVPDPSLPPDLWELVGREQPHWAGNINVFIGTRAVERHFAKALRIYSGRTNLAMFVVGATGQRDGYAFEILGLAPDWEAALHDVTGATTLVVGPSVARVQERHWVETNAGQMIVILAVRPPVVCEDGHLQVQVTRRSCQKKAVVEFGLDPTTQGAGCYVA